MEACSASGMVTKQQSVNIYIHISAIQSEKGSVFTCLKLPGSRRGWNAFSIDLGGVGGAPVWGQSSSVYQRGTRGSGGKRRNLSMRIH